jgi:MFS family permease
MNDPTQVNERQWPSEAQGWYVVLMLCLCNMFAFVDRQIINLLVEDIKIDLHITDTQISLLQGLAFALFYALAAVPLGRLADVGSRRNLIAIGIVMWTAAAAACGLARSFWQLFVARMFVGVGEATLTPSGFSMLADLFRPTRVSLPISVFTGSSFFGSGVALLLGGYVIAQLAGLDRVALPLIGSVAPWKAAFIIGASPGLVVTLLWLLSVREPARRNGALAATTRSAQPAEPGRPSLGEVAAFVRGNAGVFAAVFGGVSVLAAVQFCLGAWVPAHFIRNLGWTAPEIGYAYGVIFLSCGTGGVIAGGVLADRLQSRGYLDGHLRAVLFSALAMLPFVIAFPLMQSGATAVAVLAPAIFFGTMAFGAGPALIPVICPSRMRGLLVAIYLLIANVFGQAGGPLIVALFTDYVFGSPERVRDSLLAAPVLLILCGIGLVLLGFKGLRRMQSET